MARSVVDDNAQIIVGEHLSQNANDKKEVAPALEEIQETMESFPIRWAWITYSPERPEGLDEAEVDAYVATGREGQKRPQASGRL